MAYTKIVQNKREELAKSIDNFASFSLGNQENKMFDRFGAFIISNKQGDLKFYNGPVYDNQYVKPQFSNQNILTGINFNLKQITFTIGLYYITIEEYREFLNLVNPYEITQLYFDFNPQWYYLVKFTTIKDSPRYILNSKLDETGNEQYYYYTELQLTCDIQGEACLYSVKPIRGSKSEGAPSDIEIVSDLDIPINIDFTIKEVSDVSCYLEYSYISHDDVGDSLSNINHKIKLFKFSATADMDGSYHFNSENGLLFKINNIDATKILPGQNQRLINTLESNKALLPGIFSLKRLGFDGIKIQILFETTKTTATGGVQTYNWICIPKTNII